jgi:hypothetical protein
MGASYFLVVAVTPDLLRVVRCFEDRGADEGLPCPSCALACARLFCALMKQYVKGRNKFPPRKWNLRNASCQTTLRIALTAAAQA